MKKFFKKLSGHDLIKGSAVVFVGSMLANFLNYVFHLLTGRLLGPEKYAIVAALLSLFYVINFQAAIISTVVARKVAALAAKDDWAGIKGVYILLLKNITGLSVVLLLFFFLFKEPVGHFLQIADSWLVFLLGVSFALYLFLSISLATLQGLLRFISFSLVTIISAVLRVSFTFAALLFSLDVFGVLLAMVISSIFTYAASLLFFGRIFAVKAHRVKVSSAAYWRIIWVALALLGMSIMLNGDVMIVKHFFNSYEAGLYAALSTMGKIVFFASSAVALAMLPLVVKKKEKGEPFGRDLIFAQILVFLSSFLVTILYFLFPGLWVRLFYGSAYLPITPFLGLVAVYFIFYNLSYLFVNFFISLHRRYVLLLPLFFAGLQVVALFVFHQTIFMVLAVLIVTAALLFLSFLIYYLKYER